MSEINKANRQVCDVDIRELKTKKPFLFFDTANTTTAGITADAVYAMAKGARKIGFDNPLQGTMSITAQVYPFKLFSLFSDGVIRNDAVIAEVKEVTCASAGVLSLSSYNGTIQAGTVFVYPADSYSDESAVIAGTFSSGTFTATTASDIALGSTYKVGWIATKSGVKRIPFNNKFTSKEYYVTMDTLNKDEDGVLTPFKIIAYKAKPQRNFDLSFSSEGEPASITLNFDLLEDKDGNVADMVEITEGAVLSVSRSVLTVAKNTASADVAINGAVGAVTVTIKDSSNETATKVKAVISGDNDSVIFTVDSDADTGVYTATLTDSKTPTAQTAVVSINVVAS